jgi:hypothetical protein
MPGRRGPLLVGGHEITNRLQENALGPAPDPNRPQAAFPNPVIDGPLGDAEHPHRLFDEDAPACPIVPGPLDSGPMHLLHAETSRRMQWQGAGQFGRLHGLSCKWLRGRELFD